jgi:hypothetical protein
MLPNIPTKQLLCFDYDCQEQISKNIRLKHPMPKIVGVKMSCDKQAKHTTNNKPNLLVLLHYIDWQTYPTTLALRLPATHRCCCCCCCCCRFDRRRSPTIRPAMHIRSMPPLDRPTVRDMAVQYQLVDSNRNKHLQ